MSMKSILAALIFMLLASVSAAECGTTLNIKQVTPQQRALDYCIIDGTDADGGIIHDKISVDPKGGIGIDLAYLVVGKPHPVRLTAQCFDTADVPSPIGEAECSGPSAPSFSWVKCGKIRTETDGVTTIFECWIEPL